MGAVYLAVDPTLERQVAIKLLHRDPSNVGLREEAKVLAALNHKGIVTIHEVDVHDGHDFLVMEYLPGKTLREVLEAGKTPRMTLLEICARVAEAVAAAHRAGILHRDIKPENILVTDDEVKVLDFGIARRLATQETRSTARHIAQRLATAVPLEEANTVATAATNTIYGTPAYMAPEVLQGEPSSAASDIYSLGIVVYECVTGRRPHAGGSLVELIAQVIDAPPALLDDPHGDLIQAMLSADPANRPDLLEVSSQLAIGRTLIPGASITPVASPRRSRLWIGAGLAAVLVVGAVVAWSQRSEPPLAPSRPTVVRIAIEPIEIPVNLYGNESPKPETLTANLAKVLSGDPSRLRVQALTPGNKLDVDYRTRIVLSRDNRKLAADITIENTRTQATERIRVTASEPPIKSLRVTSILDEVTTALVHRLAPGAAIVRSRDEIIAKTHYAAAQKSIEAAAFSDARTALEAAVQADDKMYEAWYALAFVLGWQAEDDAKEVAAHARDLAPGPFERNLMTGVIEYLDGNYQQARELLEPLDKASQGKPFRREVLYFLGEAWWHDGFHTTGYRLFERVLKLGRTFGPVLIHLTEYALMHRDFKNAALYIGGYQSPNYDSLDFAAGDYQRVAESGVGVWQLGALEVLGKPVPVGLAESAYPKIEFANYQIIRALRKADAPRAATLFDDAIKTYYSTPSLEPHQRLHLGLLLEATLSAGAPAQTRMAIDRLGGEKAGSGQLRHGYHRLAILSAGLLRDPKLLELAQMTHRNTQLRAVIQAELAGDHTEAVRILQEVLRSPEAHMDLPEHAALIRNLRALGRVKEISGLCRTLLRPRVVRSPALVFQRECARR